MARSNNPRSSCVDTHPSNPSEDSRNSGCPIAGRFARCDFPSEPSRQKYATARWVGVIDRACSMPPQARHPYRRGKFPELTHGTMSLARRCIQNARAKPTLDGRSRGRTSNEEALRLERMGPDRLVQPHPICRWLYCSAEYGQSCH